jgi:hypothetical protein
MYVCMYVGIVLYSIDFVFNTKNVHADFRNIHSIQQTKDKNKHSSSFLVLHCLKNRYKKEQTISNLSKLANPHALFCSHDNTWYLVKYIDPVLELEQN